MFISIFMPNTPKNNIAAVWNMNKDSFFFTPLNTNFVFYHLYVETKLAAHVKISDSEAAPSFLRFL